MTAICCTDRHGQGIMKVYASPDPVKQQLHQTSCVDSYRTKTKRKFTNFKLLGTPIDTTSIEDRNKLQNKGSKGLATTTQLYTAK